MTEVDPPAGEPGAFEVDRAAGELGLEEVDPAGELGAAEVDRAAGKLGAAEVTAVEDDAREVKVQALPRHGRAMPEVGGDDPDDGVADLAVSPVSGLYVRI